MTINYRDTLNLPETQLSMKAGLPRKEPEINFPLSFLIKLPNMNRHFETKRHEEV